VDRRVVHQARRNRVVARLSPARADLVDRAAHAHAVDTPAGGEHGDGDGHLVTVAVAVHDVLEQERLPLGLGDAATKLPAHQRVHLGVFVDGALDADQQASGLQRGEVFTQVGVAALGGARAHCGHSALPLGARSANSSSGLALIVPWQRSPALPALARGLAVAGARV
jgi:hypothetical protein